MNTGWHDLAGLDVDEKLDELNRFLEDRGFRSRFRLLADHYGWDVLFDDGGESQIVNTVEDAERIVQELCG
jgi:hypothetical protein